MNDFKIYLGIGLLKIWYLNWTNFLVVIVNCYRKNGRRDFGILMLLLEDYVDGFRIFKALDDTVNNKCNN